MNHKWERQKDQSYTGIGLFKIWICKVCKCKKSLGYYKFAEADYDRNGQLYSHYIECVDEEAEKLKTID